MTTYYVSPTGSNTAPYDTWAKAANKLSTIAAIDAAGDTIYVDSTGTSTEGAMGANLSLAWAGTRAAPTNILSANPAHGAPPSQLTAGAVVLATGNFIFAPVNAANFGVVYCYGITFQAGVYGDGGTSRLAMAASGEFHLHLESCRLRQDGASASIMTCGSANFSRHMKSSLINTTIRVAHASSGLQFLGASNVFNGGGYESGTVSSGTLFSGNSCAVTGADLSALGVSSVLSSSASGVFEFRNCKLPASWNGSVCTVSARNDLAVMAACDNTGAVYRYQSQAWGGTVVHETTIIKTGGANNGETGISYKMTSNANNIGFPWTFIKTPEIVRWNDYTGAPITVSVDCLRDSATALTDGELWLEVNYYSATGAPIATMIDSKKASVIAAAAAIPASSATWTTTGMTNPNRQRMSVTFTPRLKGFIHATVKLCKASATVYVDPALVVS